MKKCVVMGFIGTQLDAARGARRWEKWRPTVGLCQQEDLLVHRLELLHDARSASLAERIRSEVQALRFISQAQPVVVTVSAGIGASSEPQGFLALMRTADKALYEAKRLGRNQVQMHWLQA